MSKRKGYNPHKKEQGKFVEYRERFWLIGANCLKRVSMGGMNSGSLGVEQMADSFRVRHHWRGYAMLFQTNGVQQWVDTLLCEAVVPITAEQFRHYIDAAQDRLMAEANPKYISTPGYICTISKTADMEAMRNSSIEWLQAKGAFNPEWCVYCYHLREA